MMSPMDHEPTSDDIDLRLEEDSRPLERLGPNPDLRVYVEVPMDPETLRELEARADREGRPFADVVREALRAGAAAA